MLLILGVMQISATYTLYPRFRTLDSNDLLNSINKEITEYVTPT